MVKLKVPAAPPPNAVLVAVIVSGDDDGQYTHAIGDEHRVIESLKNNAFEPLSI